MSLISLTTLILLTSSIVDSEWVSHADNTMPRGDTKQAVGNYNNIIYLLGGFNNRQQLTQYDITSDSFIFFKSAFLPNTTKVSGEAQFWTQMGSDLYILDDSDTQTKLLVYNMAKNAFNPYHIAPIVSDGMGRACLTSHANAIYINGGFGQNLQNSPGPLTNTYILNLNTLVWLQAAQMHTARHSHSCIIHPNNGVLYSFGGNTFDAMTSTVERISTLNIDNATWTHLDALSKPVRGLRSFIHLTDIIIIGGMELRNIYDLIHVIHTTDDTVELLNSSLMFATVYSAVIVVENIMYSFGGENGEWQSQKVYTAPTISPTVTTATFASDDPTATPTVMPTIKRTKTTFDGLFSSTIVSGNGGGFSSTAVGLLALMLLLVCVLLLCCFGVCLYSLINNRVQSEKKSKSLSKMSDNELDVINVVDGDLNHMIMGQHTNGMYTSLRTEDMDIDIEEANGDHNYLINLDANGNYHHDPNGNYHHPDVNYHDPEEKEYLTSSGDIEQQVEKFLMVSDGDHSQ